MLSRTRRIWCQKVSLATALSDLDTTLAMTVRDFRVRTKVLEKLTGAVLNDLQGPIASFDLLHRAKTTTAVDGGVVETGDSQQMSASTTLPAPPVIETLSSREAYRCMLSISAPSVVRKDADCLREIATTFNLSPYQTLRTGRDRTRAARSSSDGSDSGAPFQNIAAVRAAITEADKFYRANRRPQLDRIRAALKTFKTTDPLEMVQCRWLAAVAKCLRSGKDAGGLYDRLREFGSEVAQTTDSSHSEKKKAIELMAGDMHLLSMTEKLIKKVDMFKHHWPNPPPSPSSPSSPAREGSSATSPNPPRTSTTVVDQQEVNDLIVRLRKLETVHSCPKSKGAVSYQRKNPKTNVLEEMESTLRKLPSVTEYTYRKKAKRVIAKCKILVASPRPEPAKAEEQKLTPSLRRLSNRVKSTIGEVKLRNKKKKGKKGWEKREREVHVVRRNAVKRLLQHEETLKAMDSSCKTRNELLEMIRLNLPSVEDLLDLVAK